MPPRSKPAAPAATLPAPIVGRGELAIVLEGVSYTLTPTFAAIDRIETATGKALWELTQAALSTKLRTSEAATIIVHCAGQPGWNVERVGALICASEGGIVNVIADVLRPLLLLMMGGGYTALGERKA